MLGCMKHALTLALLLFSLSGCAAMFRERHDLLTVTVNVQNARVTIDGRTVPDGATLVNNRRDHHIVEVQAQGYQSQTLTVGHGSAWDWILLDALGWGLLVGPPAGAIALLVDVCTDSLWCLEPEELHVVLLQALEEH